MQLFVTIRTSTETPYRTFTVPTTGTFMQVKHDWQGTPEWGTRPRAYEIFGDTMPENNPHGGLPDTCRTLPSDSNMPFETLPVTREWQWFWYALLQKACFNRIPEQALWEAWGHVTEHGRAFTDNTAVQQGYTDYILGLNLAADKPFRHKPLTTGGNIVKVISRNSMYTIVEAFDLTEPPPSINSVWGKWWLIHWSTQSTITRTVDGAYKVTDFPQLNYNGVEYGVPFMLISNNGSVKIPNTWLLPIANGAEYSPYR